MDTDSDDLQIEDMITLLKEDITEGQRKLGLVEEVRAMLREARTKGSIPIRHDDVDSEVVSGSTPPIVNAVKPVGLAKELPAKPTQVSLSHSPLRSNPLEPPSIVGVQRVPHDQASSQNALTTGTMGSSAAGTDIGRGLIRLIAENPGLGRGDIEDRYNTPRSPSDRTTYKYISKLLTKLEADRKICSEKQNGLKCFFPVVVPAQGAA